MKHTAGLNYWWTCLKNWSRPCFEESFQEFGLGQIAGSFTELSANGPELLKAAIPMVGVAGTSRGLILKKRRNPTLVIELEKKALKGTMLEICNVWFKKKIYLHLNCRLFEQFFFNFFRRRVEILLDNFCWRFLSRVPFFRCAGIFWKESVLKA